jgi:methylated-DNA-[protein]-cysteine S-methyltransferase
MKLYLGKIPSPVGELLLVSDDQQQVRALDYADHRARLLRLLHEHYGSYQLVEGSVPPRIAEALGRYFEGDLAALDGITTATNGTELQRRVWEALRRIPARQTASYSEVARSLGFADPRAAIDVGAANKSNPVAIIVPCHRVIAKSGALKGYAGGPHRKSWLLKHEGALASGRDEPLETMRLPGL